MRAFVVVLLVGCGAQHTLGYFQPPPSREHRLGLGALDIQLASTLEREYRTERVQPPVSLVPTDGTELVLKRLSANVTLRGPLAHTELHFTFHNDENRQREGRFSITLPPSAAVTAFSMKVNGQWREARVVARQRGREVYETFLHRRVDPALLEQDLGNRFSARVFPINALEDKEITITYDHEIVDSYQLALAGLPKIEKLSVHVDNNGESKHVEAQQRIPEDITVGIVRGSAAIEYADSFVARVEMPNAARIPAKLDRVLYLVDTSASRAPVMARQVEVLKQLLAAHAVTDRVAIAVFDQASQELHRGYARDLDLSPILHHGALGASDLGAALRRAVSSGMSRVVIIGDAVPTAGEHDREALAKIIRDSSIERLDVIQVGDAIDLTTAQRLVGAGKQRGLVIDARDGTIAAQQLATAVQPSQSISVDGASHVWPPTTRDSIPGEPVFVYGLRKTTGPLTIRIGERRVEVTPGKGHTRLRRAVARAELSELVAVGASGDKIEELALAHRLVSPRTSLIVLETDSDERMMLGDNDEYVRNIPTGRTFESALGAAAGSQSDSLGISFSGATSLENQYYVDGINTTGLTFGTVGRGFGESIEISMADPAIVPGTRPVVRAEITSPLSMDLAAESIKRNAFAFKDIRRSDSWEPPKPKYRAPYTGKLHDVMSRIAKRDGRALKIATAWHASNPGDVAAILALGAALEASGAGNLAMRAYGSIADLYPNRAELLRTAGERLDRIPAARTLAVDFYRRAVRERPDHVTGYRLLAYALLRANRADDALAIILEGAQRTPNRIDIQHMLAEDAGIIGAHIIAKQPARRYDIEPRLPLGFATKPTMRAVLMWETDANDVDLHVRDARGMHAEAKRGYFADQADGWGPEMYVVEKPSAFPYKLSAHYVRKGAMGLGLGTVQVIHHDGAGGVVIEDRPFVIQNDDALVDLGTITSGRSE